MTTYEKYIYDRNRNNPAYQEWIKKNPKLKELDWTLEQRILSSVIEAELIPKEK